MTTLKASVGPWVTTGDGMSLQARVTKISGLRVPSPTERPGSTIMTADWWINKDKEKRTKDKEQNLKDEEH